MANATLRTPLCDMLDIDYPVMLAGMGPTVGGDRHGVAGPELVAAVSNAGGIGVLGGAGYAPETMASQIRRIRELTDKPFGVDILLPGRGGGGGEGDGEAQGLADEARRVIQDLHKRLGLPEISGDRWERRLGGMRGGFNADGQVDVICEMGVPLLAVGLGNPGPYVERAHAAGTKVLGIVGSVRAAREVAESGVDLVVAQGTEAGGHTGHIGTMALVPQVMDAVDPIPVVAAGGIGDGRGVAGALAMGCVGVWCGTVFIPTVEAQLDDYRKQRIIDAAAEDTRVTRVYSGKTMRNVTNEFIEAWEASGVKALPFGMQSALIWDVLDAAEEAGRRDLLMNAAGQIAGMITELRSAKDVLDDMVSGAVDRLAGGLPKEVVAHEG